MAKYTVNLQGKIEGVNLRGKVYGQSLGQSLLLIFRAKSTVNLWGKSLRSVFGAKSTVSLWGKVYGQSLGQSLRSVFAVHTQSGSAQPLQSVCRAKSTVEKQQPWSLFKAKSTIAFQGKIHGQSGQNPRSVRAKSTVSQGKVHGQSSVGSTVQNSFWQRCAKLLPPLSSSPPPPPNPPSYPLPRITRSLSSSSTSETRQVWLGFSQVWKAISVRL